MNRHLGLPPDLLAGVVPAVAIPELITGLRLKPGDMLLDLACGRAGYGLMVAQGTGAGLVGIDVSAEALAQAREQAARLGVADARFRVGDLTVSGLPDGSADAVLCTDAIQFPDDPSAAYREIRRVLKAGGRVALTCWEPVDRDDERLSARLRRVDLAAGLAVEKENQPGARSAADAGRDMGTSVCSAALVGFDAAAARAAGLPVSLASWCEGRAVRGQVIPGRFSCSGS